MRTILFASAVALTGLASSSASAMEKPKDLFETVCMASKQKGEITTAEQKKAQPTVKALMQSIDGTECSVIWTKASQLTSLDLSDKGIADVAVLRGLENLTELNLSKNAIVDISMLTTLKKLTTLNVAENQIVDISVVAQLPALTTFNGAKNQIADIEALGQLTTLTQVRLSDNKVEKVGALTSNKGLKNAYLQNNKIANLNPLAKNKKLKELNVKGNPVKSCPDGKNVEVKGKEIENTELLRGICKDEAYK